MDYLDISKSMPPGTSRGKIIAALAALNQEAIALENLRKEVNTTYKILSADLLIENEVHQSQNSFLELAELQTFSEQEFCAEVPTDQEVENSVSNELDYGNELQESYLDAGQNYKTIEIVVHEQCNINQDKKNSSIALNNENEVEKNDGDSDGDFNEIEINKSMTDKDFQISEEIETSDSEDIYQNN